MPELDLKTFADRLATVPLIAEPGTMWSYSVGLDLLGRVIEVASRMEFAEFLRQRFFVPLGMDDTDFYVPAEKVSRLAACYRRQDGKLVLSDPGPGSSYLTPPPMPSGGGGLVSSARDYHRFLQAIANGGVFAGRAIMPLEAVRIGTSNLLPPHTDMRAFLAPPGSDGFGAGGSVTSTGANAGAFGWGGAAGTIALANPRTRLAVSGYINVMDDFSFAQELPRAVFAGA